MTNFNEKLREAIEYELSLARQQDTNWSMTIATERLISTLTELVKGIVPEKSSTLGVEDNKADINGWNSCRSEMLKRLE